MSRDDESRPVDLRRYKAAKQAAAKRAAREARRPKGAGEGFLGSRPKAGLILGAVVLVLLALWFLPAIL